MKQRVIITMFETTQYKAIVDKDEFRMQLHNCDINDFFSIHDEYMDRDVMLNPKYITSIVYEEVKE